MKSIGGGRGVFAGACFLGMLGLSMSAAAAENPMMPEADLSPDAVAQSARVPSDWWSRVQRDIAEQGYDVTWQEKSCIEGLGPAWQPPNRAHNLRTYFTEKGPRVVRRTESQPTWTWGLEPVGLGTGPERAGS